MAVEPDRSLNALLRLVGSVVEVGVAPVGLDVAVLNLDVFDRPEPGAEHGDLVVAVGIDPRSEQAVALVRAAGRDGAAGVVFREEGDGPPNTALRAAAAEAGTAVLFRKHWAGWAQVIGTLRAGLTVVRDAGITNVPLGDLDALADALADLVDGAVTIESVHSRVLAHSKNHQHADDIRTRTILGREVPEHRKQAMTEDGFFDLLRHRPGARHRREAGDIPERAAIAVRAGEEIVGELWVAPAGRPLAPTVTEALEAAARIAAPHLLHDWTRRYGQHEEVREAARAVLAGRGQAELLAARTGLTLTGRCAVLSVAPAPAAGGRTDDRLAGEASMHCQRLGHPAVAVGTGRGARVLVGGLEQDLVGAVAQLSKLSESLGVKLAAELDLPVRVGVGEVRAGLAKAAGSARAADLALRALLFADSAQVSARADELPDAVALLQVLDALQGVDLPANSSVLRLVAHAAQPGKEVLIDTLRAYLENSGDSAKAARALKVPVNTFRYRLKTVEKVSGIKLDDPDARLLAQLQLRRLGSPPEAMNPA
ncbi:helix-turn-helix domain-containing protein [Kitasatospora sp. NPDC093806]|uniref:helix-turn-helix domain-containing protein n=1 Tax=Kitasatospora sp. NPDC093806 TaxID=3155075 RepID=UPI00341A8E6D